MRSEPSSKAAPHSTLDRRRRQLLARIASGVGLASALSACGGGGPDDDATLRAVNATMDVDSIDVQFNDWRFAGAVAHVGAASSYARRKLWTVGPRGQFEVRRAGGSTVVLLDTKTLPDGDIASVVVMGNLTTGLRLRVIDEDTVRPGVGSARLCLLHAWPLGGAVDAFVTLAHQPLAGRDPDHRLGAYESLSAYADASGVGRLRITPAGRTDLVLFNSASIGLAANQVATLVVSPAPGAARVAVAVLPQGLPPYVLANTVVTSQHGGANDVPAGRRYPEQPAFPLGGVCKSGHRTRTQPHCPTGPMKLMEPIKHIRRIAHLAAALAPRPDMRPPSIKTARINVPLRSSGDRSASPP